MLTNKIQLSIAFFLMITVCLWINDVIQFEPEHKHRKAAPPFSPRPPLLLNYDDMCKEADGNTNYSHLITSVPFRHNISLIVTFNTILYSTIRIVELLYGNFVEEIVYCGPGLPRKETYPFLFNKVGKLIRNFVTYTEVKGSYPGSTNYKCFGLATKKMQKPVDGYLVISDDTIFNINHIRSKCMPLSKLWLLDRHGSIVDVKHRLGYARIPKISHTGTKKACYRWAWPRNLKQLMALSNEKNKLARFDNIINQCFLNMKLMFKGENRFYGENLSDAYYIPSSFAKRFASLSNLFAKYNVFLEIAVPSIIMCLGNGSHFSFTGMSLGMSSGVKRNYPYKYIAPEKILQYTFSHPFKWSHIVKSPEIRHGGNEIKSAVSFICRNILPRFYSKGPFQCNDN